MKNLHVAVVGAGSFGRHHVRHLSRHRHVGTVTVVDRDGDRAKALAEAHGANAAQSAEGLSLDAAVVAVPTEAHFAVAAPLLAAGIHTLVEKPLTESTEDAETLIEIASGSGAVLQVGHIERFASCFEAIVRGCGRVRHIAARRHNPPRPTPPSADVVLDLMIHDIDLALRLAGAPVVDVRAFAPDGVGKEAVTAHLKFANGAVAELSASRLAAVMERNLIVHDRRGVFHADLVARAVHRCEDGRIFPIEVETERDSLATEIDEFIAAVIGERRPRVSGTAGMHALEVANDIRAALVPVSVKLFA